MAEMTRIVMYTATSIECPAHLAGSITKFCKDRQRSVFSGINGAAVLTAVYDEHGERLTGGDENNPSDELLDLQEDAILRLTAALEKENLIA